MGDGAIEDFDALYRAQFGRLATALRLACDGDAAAGEELAQETFARAWARWSRVGQLEKPEGWLYVTGFNLVRRRWRTTKRLARIRVRDGDHASATAGAVPREGHADESARSDERLGLERAVLALPRTQRTAVVARHLLGLSTAESALVVGVSNDALRALLHRGLVSLRQSPALSPEGDDHGR